ncbi:MAG TPA: hypothetical protein VFP20_08160 [Bacteroidales bacterium]|nr:hypothetical protein [Bacteroidales bacterium]
MQERDTYEKIRSTLLNAEVQPPDFDTLFGKVALGSDSLRSALASKLAESSVEAPDFESLFAGETLGKPVVAPKVRLSPWWSMVGVAAACLAAILLLPKNLGPEVENISKVPAVEQVAAPVKKSFRIKQTSLPKLTAQLLNSPSAIKPLSVENQNTTLPETLPSEASRDTASTEAIAKIAPTHSSRLLIKTEKSVEEAYAVARVRKPRLKPDKMTFGLGMNSANRMLSMVNAKSDGGFALQSVASSGSDGYTSLEGASATFLKTTTVSPNEWIGPENITRTMLQNCETNYLLPINLGLTVSIPIIHDMNLITGLQYTYMANHLTGATFDLNQELHYLGIPVKLAVNLVKRGDFVVYSALGGTIEKGLVGVQTSTVDGEGTWRGTQSIKGFQTSLTGQFGLSYSLNTKLLLYLEPGVAWYIPSDQPVSNRTEEPFNFNLSLGIRYRLQ